MDKHLQFIKSKAKRAYEFARLKRSLWVLIPASLFGVCGVWLCSTPAMSVCAAVLISAFAVFFLWRGDEYGKAVIPALVIGALGVTIPAFAHSVGLCCQFDLEIVICGSTGLLMGFLHGYAPAKNKNLGFKYLLSGVVIISLAGSIGCSYLGLTGLIGVGAGTIFASTLTYFSLRKLRFE